MHVSDLCVNIYAHCINKNSCNASPYEQLQVFGKEATSHSRGHNAPQTLAGAWDGGVIWQGLPEARSFKGALSLFPEEGPHMVRKRVASPDLWPCLHLSWLHPSTIDRLSHVNAVQHT